MDYLNGEESNEMKENNEMKVISSNENEMKYIRRHGGVCRNGMKKLLCGNVESNGVISINVYQYHRQ